ncbi:glucosaminidase domain-containing protein [Marinobacter halophilus]|uniref:Bax protein n=1 Tax=Marinobacter halophilus TaxID=1323740 RepID=A0A2T1KDJ0_9GAMM|nr:glucosaminidase domain-containing protein [Marinobacter halophilus]PSF07823.1 bax protein [Marinobacter halophilus]GGC57352.1 Bax protein [Marinobacter halophilus]
MTAVNRALMLCVPLFLFAAGGAWYASTSTGLSQANNDNGEVTLASLPRLPAWAEEDLPDFSGYRDTTERKVAFFSFLYPRIVLANSRILLEREYLESLSARFELSDQEVKWLSDQSQRLRVEAETGSLEQFALLRKRLDVIPPSLILAQAANESAWGTSRFALEGNNLFGQWCFSKGCGLVPQSRVEGANHEVAKFSSPYQSVRSYIQNLNRHPTYQLVRDLRLQDRQADKPLSGIELAEGLLGYSERGEDYIKEIRSMIRYNNLEFYDREFRALLGNRSPNIFERLASADADTTLLPGAEGSVASPFEG